MTIRAGIRQASLGAMALLAALCLLPPCPSGLHEPLRGLRALQAGQWHPSPTERPVVGLYSLATPELKSALSAPQAPWYPVEGFRNDHTRARTVLIAGHSLPPTYLGRPATALASAIASFKPDLVVLDTCYGASTPILEALVAAGCRATVVAAPYRIPHDGLVYAPDFLDSSDPMQRARRIRTAPPFPLLVWRLAEEPLRAVAADISASSGSALKKRLKRVSPPLVKAVLNGAPSPGNVVLVPVSVQRFADQRDRSRPGDAGR